MRSDWKITCFKPNKEGIFPTQNGVKLATACRSDKECGVILYGAKGQEIKIPFQKEGRQGNLYGIQIEGQDVEKYLYNFYEGNKIITDSYARGVAGLEKWGLQTKEPRETYGSLEKCDFDWEGDETLCYPYEDSILYGLNVRSFTMHKSSGVKNKGTFEGIVEKISYLKDLGVTALELMPCYEYEECLLPPQATSIQSYSQAAQSLHWKKNEMRINCWGFQQGYYFAPKASYSKNKSPQLAFKSMVKELHKNGLEVMMQFYFPLETKQLYILEVIKFWVQEYHIDGVRISGIHIPFRLLAEDEALANTKIWCKYLPDSDMDVIGNTGNRNFAIDNGDFRNETRRFLKGDEGLINQVLYRQRTNPPMHAVINYIADYDGFSLYDCVSYDRKHNESNGEDNRDGEELNYTWNCGMEGESRKKSVQDLRLKQLKNALSFVFLAQGTPYLFSGDEFINSRMGNNNCYCQDDEVGWIKWKNNQLATDLLTYIKYIIGVRKEHRILHMKDELKIIDSKACGYPDISYHGIEAWRPDLGYVSRMVGVMLCGQYAGEDQSFYIAYNMHWEPHKLALPKLPKGYGWKGIVDTSIKGSIVEKTEDAETDAIKIKERSVAIYCSERKEEPEKTVAPKSKKRTSANNEERRTIHESMESL